ncbi:3-oxoacyl-ACP reductase FabG [Alteribacillus sp. HJP-4]|uniref:3-oxoacyl-ACP reductase FabG n=1 Tax=Alteribacillus sp. HJP-4 TaxID=2775394 RepID=UPI0035CCD4BA
MRLQHKTAIITGAARGIGAAAADKFVREGAKVVLVDLHLEDVLKTASILQEKGGEVLALQGDVTSKQDTEAIVSKAISHFEDIHILVNNAGITSDAQLLKMEEEQWDQVINVNLKGVFLMTKALAPHMKQKNRGVILNASSVVGMYGNFGQTNYAATKAGLNGMTKSWAKELGRYQIRVNSVAPGFILSPMTEKMPEKVLQTMKEKSVLQDLGRPEDIADAYAFLASDEARFITGTVLSVDGGVVI